MKLKIKIFNNYKNIFDCKVYIKLSGVTDLNYEIESLYNEYLIKYETEVDKEKFKNLDYIQISITNKNEVNNYKDHINFNGFITFKNLEYLPKNLTFEINEPSSYCDIENITCNEIDYLKACQKIGACIDAKKVKIIKSINFGLC